MDSFSVLENWSKGHGSNWGSFQPPLGQGFIAQLCYDVESEFPDPQVHPSGNKILKKHLETPRGYCSNMPCV